ncbi:hypothetical protein Tco_1284364 [Tanacetum coccineum]
MSNTNNNLHTQTSNALHNAIMEAGGKDRPPMLALAGINDAIKVTLFDVITNLYWEFGKFTTRDGESLDSYYSRFYKMMNELVKNQCEVTNHEVNVQFLLQLKLECSSTRPHAATRNKGKAIRNHPSPIYDSEPEQVVDDETSSKEKKIDKLMALISMSFKKIYKPTNNNLRTSSNSRNTNVDNTSRSNRGTGYDRQTGQYDNQGAVNVTRARKNVSDWRDDTDDEPGDHELEAHYVYMAKIQEVIPDAADNSGPIFEILSHCKSFTDHSKYLKMILEKVKKNIGELVGLIENPVAERARVTSNNGEEADHDDQMLQKERELLASLIEQMKIEIDESKQNNKSLESSNKAYGIGYQQKDKNKAKTGQNRARDWKERGKPKPKTYAS